jgi:hypothetical protein
MQTFLPFADNARSARCLDRMRLGKPRVEALQLLKGQWSYHPASRMWRGYSGALARYTLAVCAEWTSRGYADSVADQVMDLWQSEWNDSPVPPWFGAFEFHRAHRSNLLRKNPEYYAPLFEPGLPDNLDYLWPEV